MKAKERHLEETAEPLHRSVYRWGLGIQLLLYLLVECVFLYDFIQELATEYSRFHGIYWAIVFNFTLFAIFNYLILVTSDEFTTRREYSDISWEFYGPTHQLYRELAKETASALDEVLKKQIDEALLNERRAVGMIKENDRRKLEETRERIIQLVNKLPDLSIYGSLRSRSRK
jgi:hypothetical protein